MLFRSLFPLRQANAKSIVKHLEEDIFLKYGVPQTIVMDNGSQYVSHELRNLTKKYKVPNLFYNCKFHPQNNPVERINRVLVTAISSYVGHDHRKWTEELAKIEYAINTAVHEVTGFSPHFINFGRESIVLGSWYQSSSLTEQDIRFTDRKIYTDSLNEMDSIYTKVGRNLNKAYERNRKYYNLRRRPHEYSVNEVVWKRDFPLSDAGRYFSSKLAPKFIKCRVVRKVSALVYELCRLDSNKNIGRWHVKDILKSSGFQNSDDVANQSQI